MVLSTPVPEAAGQRPGDGSVFADWIVRVPREGPPSFSSEGGAIGWELDVEVRFASGKPSTQSFALLVAPKVATA